MPYSSVLLTPGINVEETAVLNSAGFSESVAVRFFNGLAQKVGGFKRLTDTKLIGTARGMHAWGDLIGNDYLAVGTEQRLEIFTNGQLFDITPIRYTSNPTPNFSTVINTPTVTVIDPGNGALQGDWVDITVPVSVGGLVLFGFYQVTTDIDANTYTLTAASNATVTINNGGVVPEFTTTLSSSIVTVTFPNHGFAAGAIFSVLVATNVGGLTVAGPYTVVSPTTNTFTIDAVSLATSGASAFENGGNTQIEYLIHTGQSSASIVTSSGFGSGLFGGGVFGGGSSGGGGIVNQMRIWSLSNFGQDLVANYNGSPIYIWSPPFSEGNVAVELNTLNFPEAVNPPTQVNYTFESTATQQIIALGCDDPTTGLFDPNLVRWCDSSDFTDWQASSTNQAGSFRIPSGSKLVGGISTANFNIIWTDVDMWLMTYIGAQFVWSFSKIADAVDLVAPLACGVYQNVVVWPSRQNFYIYAGGGVQSIPCPVWDKFWFNLNQEQIYKVNVQVNSWFSEVSWAFQSLNGSDCDARITYNVDENTWTYDDPPTLLARTSWVDDNVFGAPIGAATTGYLQQTEQGYDADGVPLPASVTSGWFALSETDYAIYIERLIGDFIVTGGSTTIKITIFTQNWPEGPVTTYGPYNWTAGSIANSFTMIHARGRLARIKIESSDLGVFWRNGRIRYLGQPAGRYN